jgi:hypothetical protein
MTSEDRATFQLTSLIQLAGILGNQVRLIRQDNSDENHQVYDLLYDGILDDVLCEIRAVENLLSYVMENHKPQTACPREEDTDATFN